ncbi:hypothetical protein EBT25_14870 [bacterium]|nr:hypothetical protein [bacterium]
MILRVALIDHSRIVGDMETITATEQEAWLEYELVQGDLDAEREEFEFLAWVDSLNYGYEDYE